MNNQSSHLKELVISTFQEILADDPNFFFNDRLSILTWKSKKINGALITKVGNRRYLGLLRKDSQGQDYWKYKPLNQNSESESSAPPNLSALEKFNQRQAKVQNYGKYSEQINQQSQSNR